MPFTPSQTSPPHTQRIRDAAGALRAGRPAAARAILAELLTGTPAPVEAITLTAAAFVAEGRPGEGLGVLRRTLLAQPGDARLHIALGETLLAVNDALAAEASFRRALGLDPFSAHAARLLAELLIGAGRPSEAVEVLSPLTSGPRRHDQSLLHALADALRADGRTAEALAIRRGAAAAPTSTGIAHHNLAALLGDLGDSAGALEAVRDARRRGLDAPETDLVEARALCALGRFSAAEAAFRRVLERRPLSLEAHRDLAQALWMSTGDVGAAVAALDAALARHPGEVGLMQVKAKALTFAGRPDAAFEALTVAAALRPDDPSVRIALSQAAVAAGRTERGLNEARAAFALSPAHPGVTMGLIEALLAAGRAREALDLSVAVLAQTPGSQAAIAYLATAARILGDARYETLYDYAAFVRPMELSTPAGWRSLPAYLSDLAAALLARHSNRTHPFDQSLRSGSQLANVLALPDAPIAAFREARRGAIRAYIDALGPGADPFRAAGQGGWRTVGAWSVRLSGGGGRHVNHIHGDGWISSVAYISLPGAVRRPDLQEGWITFGEPGVVTRPPLQPAHTVRPEEGLVVLFPSFMWHGTTPYSGQDPRLTIAYDLAAAPRGVED